MLEYYLEQNLLTDSPDDFRAQVVNVKSYSTGDIIDQVMKIGAGLTRSDVLSVVAALKQVCADIVAGGGAINTDLVNAYPSVPGVFTAAGEPSAPAAHINLSAGKALRDAAAGMKTRKVTPPQTGTVIENVIDARTGSLNDKITHGRDLRINGVKLKIAGDAPEVGVYFVNVGGGTRVKVESRDIVENQPGSLLVVVPDLPAGTVVNVEVVTQFSGSSTPLKVPRTATFNKPLTVV